MSDPEGVIRCIRRTIHNLELHEADEMILVGGQRIFDPHL